MTQLLKYLVTNETRCNMTVIFIVVEFAFGKWGNFLNEKEINQILKQLSK